MRGLLPGPLLVAAAIAGPDLDGGAVGSASAGHIEAQTGLNSDDGAIGVQGPLLVGPTVAVPDLHAGPRCCGMIGHVETLVAEHLQLAIRQRGPLLVGPAAAVPDLQQGAVGRSRPWYIQAAIGAHSPQNSGTTAAATTAPVSRRNNVGLNSIFGRVRGIAGSHRAFKERTG